MNENFERMTQALSEDNLTEDQARELLLECKKDSQVLQEVADLYALNCLLRASGPSDKINQRVLVSLQETSRKKSDQTLQARVMRDIRTMSDFSQAEEAQRAKWFSAKAVLALAASVLLFAGFWWVTRSPNENVATIVRLKGSVAVQGRSVQVNDEIPVGAIITTGKDGDLKLAFGNGVADVDLRKNSQLRTAKSKSEKTLHLELGELFAKVTKQPQDSPFIITTPQAYMRVVGTEFIVLADEKVTQLKVSDGEVLMKGLDNQAVAVKEGFMATAGLGAPINPVLIESGLNQPSSERIVFFRDFEMISPGENSPNELVVLKEPGGEVTVIESKPSYGHSPKFSPDVELTLMKLSPNKAKMETLYVVPINMEIRIRIKSEFPGKWSIGKTPTNPRFKMEHFFATGLDVDSEWKEVILRSSDFRPYRAEKSSRDFVPGVEICAFTIYGFGTGTIYLDSFAVVSSTSGSSSR